jgi:hypothetical protein
MDYVYLSQDEDQLHALVNEVRNFQILWKGIISWLLSIVRFSQRIILYKVI